MRGLLLNAFYNSVQYSIGWVLAYTFAILLAIGVIYSMAKYIFSRSDK